MTRWDVLGFGAVAVDDLIYVERFPPPDGKAPVCTARREAGGLAGTALAAAARLGARAAYCGVLGDDRLSRFTRDERARYGVDCTPIMTNPDARPIHATIVVEQETGRRCIFFSSDGVMHVPLDAIDRPLITSARVLFVDCTAIAPGVKASRIAREHGIPIVGDIEPGGDPALPELVQAIDHLIVGVEMAQQLTGHADPAAGALLGPGRACATVTASRRLLVCYPGVPNRHVPTEGQCGRHDRLRGRFSRGICRVSGARSLDCRGGAGGDHRRRAESTAAGRSRGYPGLGGGRGAAPTAC